MTLKSLSRLKSVLVLWAALWAGCVILSMAWNITQVRKNTLSVAHAGARVAFEKDIAYRRWNTLHGGVYVTITDDTRPNPYLNVPERDIETTSGKKLTLMNPAYMTRQVHEISFDAYGLRGHITSLKPIRPENAPAPWEAYALNAFHQGKREVFSIESENGKDYFRLMCPLITEEGCLVCHAAQGYKVGDVRGGISVSIPMKPVWQIEKSLLVKLSLAHLFLLLTGLFGIIFFGNRLKNQMIHRLGMEKELKKTNDLLEKIYSTVHFCIVFLDNRFNFVRVNRAYAETCSHTPAFFQGKNHFELYPHEENEAIFRQVVETGKPFTIYGKPFEFPDQPGRGTTYWDWTLHPVMDDAGNVEGLIYVLVDVTQAKKAEIELIEHGKNLQKKIEKRTRELETTNLRLTEEIKERRLIQNEYIKMKKLEATGLFAGGIAHDFNNLLHIILGNITIIKDNLDEHDMNQPMLRQVETAVFRARDLTRKFITFSTGGDPVKSIVAMHDLLREVKGVTLSGTNISSKLDFQDELASVEVDAQQMRQVLVSVMENAKDAMMDGGTLRIATENTTADQERETMPPDMAPGPYVKITISDNGIGIPQQHINQIFDPYFSTKHRGADKGMGLGLSVVHSIIQKHKGYIHVESRLKQGTDVHIYLPAMGQMVEKKKAEASLRFPLKRILVMDDEEPIRILSSQMLERLGYEADVSAHGREAIEMYRKALDSSLAYDLVLLDLTIKGGMGGVETFRELKTINPDIRGVIISGYSSDPMMSDYRSMGFSASLTKPVTMNQLKELLETMSSSDQ